jgi:hypothetical protein
LSGVEAQEKERVSKRFSLASKGSLFRESGMGFADRSQKFPVLAFSPQ